MFLNDKNITVKFFKDEEFDEFRRALDRKMKVLTKAGYRKEVRQAQVITDEMEAELWRKAVLGSSSPKILLRTIFFLAGKHFALRSREISLKNKISILSSMGVQYLNIARLGTALVTYCTVKSRT